MPVAGKLARATGGGGGVAGAVVLAEVGACIKVETPCVKRVACLWHSVNWGWENLWTAV